MNTPEAIGAALISPNVVDANFEPANVVDVINHLSNNTKKVAEAVMGVTAGLMAIANAINRHTQELKESEK